MMVLVPGAAVVGLSAAIVGSLFAQGGALDRVAGVRNGMVEFHFASHGDTCGDGLNWMRTGENSWSGSFISTNDPALRAQCARGPVRVLLTKAEGEVVRLEAFVGPLQHAAEATDLGAIPARDASAWLLALARRADGRTARDAILPAVLADSVTPAPALIALARDTDRARATRRSAISWLTRAPGASPDEVAQALSTLARDANDTPSVRQSAVSALSRLDGGVGVAALSRLARESTDDAWLAREATRVLARSGDPRARDFLRDAVANAQLPNAQRAAAIAGLGNDMATGADARLMRDSYRTLDDGRLKDATLNAVAAVGGRTNVDWLLGVARDADEAPAQRRRAVSQAERAGATGVDLARLFDEVDDTDTRNAVISALAQEGSRPARDKLIEIAKSTELGTLRRRAISALNRFDGPEVQSALFDIGSGRP